MLIWLAYLAIPTVLIYFIRKRREMPFPFLFWLFGVFILSCGFTHFLEVVTFYTPMYRLSGIVKFITALASWATVVALIPITPRAMAMRSPEDLAREIKMRKQVEQELEQRVEARTADLRVANEALQREMTQHKKAEDKFKSLLESAPDAMVIIDEQGIMVLVNSQTETMFGYRHEELIGRKVEILIPERYRTEHSSHRASFVFKGVARPMGVGQKLYGLRKNGQEFRVEIGLSPVQTDEGLLVISAIRDITQRERILADMHKAEARFRTMVEKIPAVTFIASLEASNPAANELYVSPQIQSMLGFSQKEWLEDPVLWYRQLHPEDRDRWNIEFAPTCFEGKPFSAVYRFLARDGRVVWVRGEAQVVMDDNGQSQFLQGFAFDITAIMQAENDLRQLNHSLEERVRERTALADQRAHELARSNGDLAQLGLTIAHDLKEPIRTIRSYTQKMVGHCQHLLDEKALNYVDRVVKGGARMEVMISDLLIYSRVGTVGESFANVEFSAVFESACANLAVAIEECSGQVTATNLPSVWGDKSQLLHLLQNLIINALKFRSESPPHIDIIAQRQNEEWLIKVTDNGIGIEYQYLQQIFNLGMGSRLNSVQEFPGNGIGLATCEKIVQRHAGRIWADSPGLGHGTTIAFTLPIKPK